LTGTCTADLNALDEGLVTETGYLEPEEVIEMIQERPIGGLFAVSNMFSFYSYGLVKPGDNNCLPAG